jgi:hypothetical protein
MTTHTGSDDDRGRHRARVCATATVAAIVPWIAARIIGVELDVVSGGLPPMVVSLPMVLSAALGASLAAWGLLAMLERRIDSARRTWTAVATTVLVLSLVPLALPIVEATTAARATLVSMHVVVGAVLIAGLPRGAAERQLAGAVTGSGDGDAGRGRTRALR